MMANTRRRATTIKVLVTVHPLGAAIVLVTAWAVDEPLLDPLSPFEELEQVPVSGLQTVVAPGAARLELDPWPLDPPAVCPPAANDPDPPPDDLEPWLVPEPAFPTVVGCCAPPVPVVHWVGPCLSQAGGKGAFLAKRFVPSGENVGLLQLWMLMFSTTAPGIFRIWSNAAWTRLMGIGE